MSSPRGSTGTRRYERREQFVIVHGRFSSFGQPVKGTHDLLLSRAAAFGADLLVMSAYGHSHLREWMLGGVTRTVLYEADLPVLMSR